MDTPNPFIAEQMLHARVNEFLRKAQGLGLAAQAQDRYREPLSSTAAGLRCRVLDALVRLGVALQPCEAQHPQVVRGL